MRMSRSHGASVICRPLHGLVPRARLFPRLEAGGYFLSACYARDRVHPMASIDRRLFPRMHERGCERADQLSFGPAEDVDRSSKDGEKEREREKTAGAKYPPCRAGDRD